jgi:hypothetical protein
LVSIRTPPFRGAVGGRAGHGDLSEDRTEVDDRAAPGRRHRWGHRPHAQEGAVQVDRDRAPPGVHRRLEDRLAALADAGGIDQHIQPAEPRQGRVDHLGPARLIHHVLGQEGRGSAFREDLVGDGLAGLRREVGEHDFGAFAGEPAAALGAQPGRPAGDQRHLALDPSRHSILRWFQPI